MPVAFISAGYGGAVTQESWANMASLMGHTYSVDGLDSWAVTPAAGDRAVSISPGAGMGHGVRDVTTDQEQLFIPAVTSGTLRYDMIVVRRDWATKTTAFAIVTGSSARALPLRQNNPGLIDEHPIALVRVNVNSTTIGEVVDLRVWASNAGMVGYSDLVRSYLNKPGARVRIGGDTWSYEPTGDGFAAWVNQDGSGPWVEMTPGKDWVNVATPARCRYVMGGKALQVFGELVYRGPDTPREGWIVATIPAGMRPVESMFLLGTTDFYSKGFIYPCDSTGNIRLGPFPIRNVAQFATWMPLK